MDTLARLEVLTKCTLAELQNLAAENEVGNDLLNHVENTGALLMDLQEMIEEEKAV